MAITENALNLAQGFPEFNPPSELIEAVHSAMLNNKNQYPPMPGYLSFREQIAKKESDLMEAFKTAGLTDDEQQKYRAISEESSAFGKALKADATLSDEEKAAKSKEYGKAKAARLKELLGAEKYKALKDVQNAQKEAAKAN